VEASPGHEIGIVSLTGEVVNLQMKRKKVDPEKVELKKIYRHARGADIEKWFESIALEDDTLYKTKKIAEELGLDMKLNDVEYQGDKTKAIFYYTANERVDFRILIRRLAEEFKVRIEMRQIGARQEASKLGGIGSCGRELCCASHMSNFKSVSTNSARVQQLSLNPQKLAGQCGKLKCCLNYELDHYLEILEEFSDPKIILKSKKGNAVHQKSDIFKRVMLYSYVNEPNSMLVIPVDQVKKIIEMNQKGKLPNDLEIYAQQTQQVTGEDSSSDNEGYVSYI
jgi:cell fate regulator YaaT (PSP1 superfamily)